MSIEDRIFERAKILEKRCGVSTEYIISNFSVLLVYDNIDEVEQLIILTIQAINAGKP